MLMKTLSVVTLMLTGLGCTGPTPASSDEQAEGRSAPSASRRTVAAEAVGERSGRGFVADIEKLTEQNGDFRRVVYTAKHSQLVVMALPAGEHIGAETHADVDQFFRVEQGEGEVVLGSVHRTLAPGTVVVVPAGTKHDVTNTGDKPLKLYTIYSPPQHRDGVVHHTRADAEKDSEHFDGRTTE